MFSYPVPLPWAGASPRRATRWGHWLLRLLLAAAIWGWVDVRQRGYPYPEDPTKHKSDLTVYTEAGAAFFDGRPPYAVSNVRGCTYVYPPLLALLLAPLHVLPSQDQVTVWFFPCLAMCWGCYCESRRIVKIIGGESAAYARWFPWLGLVTAAAATFPTLNCLQRGQVSVVTLYFLLLGLRLVLTPTATGRPGPILAATTTAAPGMSATPRQLRQSLLPSLLGGIVLALPVAVKVVPALPVGFLLLLLFGQWLTAWRNAARSRANAAAVGRRLAGTTLGVAFGMFLFLFLLPAALIGWDANLRHLGTWSQAVLGNAQQSTATPGFETDTHSARNQCLGNAVYRLGNFGSYVFGGGPEDPLVDTDHMPKRLMDSPVVERALLLVRIALLLALLLAGMRLARYEDSSLTLPSVGQQPPSPLTEVERGEGGLSRQAANVAFSRSANAAFGRSLAAGFGVACVAMLVLSPVARGHYFMLWAPAVLLLPLWLDHRGRAKAARIMALVPAVLTIAHYVLLPLVGRIGLLGLGATGWLMAATVLIDRSARPAAVAKPAVAKPAAAADGPLDHFPTSYRRAA